MAPTTPKKKTEVVTDEDRQPGVIYIGHVPHGFYEEELKKYFSQFGKVLQIKLSRSKKSGKSKGYAFVKFQYTAVAKTVADTCHNYLFFDKLLKCEYKKPEDLHKDTFFSYDWRPNIKPKRLHNTAKSEVKVQRSAKRSSRRQADKLKKLKELGIDLQLDDVLSMPVTNVTAPPKSEGSGSTPAAAGKAGRKVTPSPGASVARTNKTPKTTVSSNGTAVSTPPPRTLKRKRPGSGAVAVAKSRETKAAPKKALSGTEKTGVKMGKNTPKRSKVKKGKK
ncbi:MKI67 FHA domain-interacting nucleolar phosphoprotein [Aplysia californica]|uniref:MKI67 FHA domain-interacting nucleolar phosphoprotein n=1 Tax=Aplysia californica TaxID=6500 RepID=A0ABM0K2D0_APLCA|nr:MKI67 FHA domain-interacting nucleolar phosphoprotein [Aplysia californica]